MIYIAVFVAGMIMAIAVLPRVSGRGSGVVGYNVQIAVEANHHLIVMHEVTTNDGTDRSQLSHVANETKAALGVEKLDAVADRGYFTARRFGHARRLVSRLRCQSR